MMAIDNEWLCALGRAVMYFSFVEIAVVSIINSLVPTNPSYLQQTTGGKKTAGAVAQDFRKHIGLLPEGSSRSELEKLATRFTAAVNRRNDMIHAMPASLGEETHLVRLTQDKFVVWSKITLAEAASEFEKLGDDLYVAHHNLQGCLPLRDSRQTGL